MNIRLVAPNAIDSLQTDKDVEAFCFGQHHPPSICSHQKADALSKSFAFIIEIDMTHWAFQSLYHSLTGIHSVKTHSLPFIHPFFANLLQKILY
jgi:hypothetical protein